MSVLSIIRVSRITTSRKVRRLLGLKKNDEIEGVPKNNLRQSLRVDEVCLRG